MDKANNQGTESSPIKVTVDKIKPTSTIYRFDGSSWIQDAGSSWQKTNFIRRSYDSDSGTGLDKCYYYVYDNVAGASYSGTLQRTCSALLYDISVTVGASAYCRNQAENGCSLYVYSVDKAGNQSDYGVAVYNIDYTAPTVGQTSPITALEGVAQTYSATVSDNLKLNYCWLYVDGASKGSMAISPSPCQNGASCTASMSYTFASGGIHPMYARCADQYDTQTASYLNFTSGSSVNVNVTADKLPVITSGPSYTTSPCASPTTQTGCNVNFTVSATDSDGDPLTYSWIFGDGGSSNLQNPSYHYATATTYAVIITVSDNRGGATSSGVTLPVTAPTLLVALSANPSTWVDSLSGVDLTATTSGTMSGTINYKFDCKNDGGWELQINNTTTNPYTAVDLCNYASIGNYTAKVFIERGDGNAQATTGISVVSNQPPVCQISVSKNGTVDQWIDINVSGSSDPEGSLASVNFSSDNILNGSPNGTWDPLGPYSWTVSSGNWSALNKTMKWSFASAGSYETWAQLTDNVGLTNSCYATTTITSCLPGNTKNCTSSQGCNHTLTCQAAGTWPACPTDQCAPGTNQSCGTNGTQVCTPSCSWGICAEQGNCAGTPPPSCPTCYQPVCVASAWQCQPAEAQTDSGDCRECDGNGNSVYLCAEICVADTCTSCSIYDGGCGYGGCGVSEKPSWSYSGGICQYACQYNVSCEGEIPPPPPTCQRGYPTVTLNPSSQAGTAGQQLLFTVYVINTDSSNLCGDSTFSLAKSCPSGWPGCSLDLSSLTISPNQSKSTILRVTSPSPPYTKGNYNVSVTATNNSASQYLRTAYGVYQVTNNPPQASASCYPQGCSQSAGSCSGYTWTSFCLKNNSTDPDDTSDIKNSIWTITGQMEDTSNCLAVSGNPVCNWTLPSNFTAGNYSAQLYVEDKTGASDTVYKSFSILQDIIAEFDCSLNSEGPWQECETLKASEGEIVYFRDKSTPSDGGSPIVSRSWTFEDGTPAASVLQYPSSSFQKIDQGSGRATLMVTDSNGRSDTTLHQVWVTIPLPEWQEIPPL